nr:hypothetical protein [Tanacetum cinerariifolium]
SLPELVCPYAQQCHVPFYVYFFYIIFINLVNVLKFNLRAIGLRSNKGTSSVLTDCGNINTTSGKCSGSSGNTHSVAIFIVAVL